MSSTPATPTSPTATTVTPEQAFALDVLALHRPVANQVVTGDCAIEECGHEDECPTVDLETCAACAEIAEQANEYYGETNIGIVAYPCPTVQLATKHGLTVEGAQS